MSQTSMTRIDRNHLHEPIVPTKHAATQSYNMVRRNPLALDAKAGASSIDSLDQLLADTMTLRDLYKKHHWQASGPNFYSIHLLFDKHYEEQAAIVDLLAERVQTLGGVAIAMAADVAQITMIPRAPRDRESTEAQFTRLLQAHEMILLEARAIARTTAESGDLGTNDLIVADVIRKNELQVWFLAEHLQPTSTLEQIAEKN